MFLIVPVSRPQKFTQALVTNPMSQLQKHLSLQGVLLLLVSCLFFYISYPGLSGNFTLDDWPNLANLEHIKNPTDLWIFSLSGVSSSLGRPLAYLSFALQAQHWPHNPFPFKLAGLLIHIANALLVYGCCYWLARLISWPKRNCFLFAGIIFGLWLFLPIHISSVFYIIQRMTLLAGFFTLLGIGFFLSGFYLDNNGHRRIGRFIATAGLIVCYTAGILSKENAILLGLYISVMYFIFLQPRDSSSFWKRWTLILGVAPPVLILLYLYFSHRYLYGYAIRHFTPIERLLTEAVILWDYVIKIFIPTPTNLNIFNDGFPVSRGLIYPSYTLAAVVGWLVMIILALRLKKTAPFFSFAILWFLAGHLLESTFIGLELYFEHRNYLPSLGLIIGLVGLLFNCWEKANHLQRYRNAIKTFCLTVTLGLFSWFVVIYGVEVKTWSTPGRLAISALIERPQSLRARQEAAAFFANTQDYLRATLLLHQIEQEWPGYPGTYEQLIMLNCLDENVKLPASKAIHQRFQTGKFERGTQDAFHEILKFKKQGLCPQLGWNDYRDLIESVLLNPAFILQQENLFLLITYSYNAEANYAKAAEALDRLPESHSDIQYLFLKAQFFAMAGRDDESLQIIERIKTTFKHNLRVWLPYEQRVYQLEAAIKQKINDESTTTKANP